MRVRTWFAGVALIGALSLPARAEVKLHALISEGMVLQRGAKAPIWGTAEDGETVTVRFQGKERKAPPQNKQWRVILEDLMPGGPYEMTIAGKNTVTLKEVYVGDVWVCSGQSNMEWPVRLSSDPQYAITNSKNPNLRLFTVPKTVATAPVRGVLGKWVECGPDTVANFSAVAYFFGRDVQKAGNVPVGLIHTSWGGTPAEAWTSRPSLAADTQLKGYVEAYEKTLDNYLKALDEYKEAFQKARAEQRDIPEPPTLARTKHSHLPTGLYNGMIAPLLPYAIRGAIWYQGESNAGRAYQYRTLFPAMIADWRKAWGQGDFPFLFVQLAPFMKIEAEPKDSAWAELREAQMLTMKNVPNTAMAVITDVGDEKDIHPRQKEPVGARLALAARALAGGEKIEYSGPLYRSMSVDGNKAVVRFDHVGGGLVARGGPLVGFTVAGADGQFVRAEAVIQEDRVVVWSPQVEKPAAVRFGWANYPVVNLWNKDGLPASPFRSDDLPMLTKPK